MTIDLHGQDTMAPAHEPAALPPGRYVLVPGNEIEDDEALPAEDASAVLEDVDRGDTVDAEEVSARMRGRLACFLVPVQGFEPR